MLDYNLQSHQPSAEKGSFSNFLVVLTFNRFTPEKAKIRPEIMVSVSCVYINFPTIYDNGDLFLVSKYESFIVQNSRVRQVIHAIKQ